MLRLDIALSRQNNISREAAKALIQGGKALVNGISVTKPSFNVSCEDMLQITKKMRYVSRGGEKLEKALQYFNIDLTEKICIDIGASTGGFTDCMLKHGAKKVYAIDVGHSQLAHVLKCDERIVSFEKINVKNIPEGLINETAGFAGVDVSFISLCKILGSVYDLFSDEAVFLVKPQFEAGKNVSIKNKRIHEKVLRNVINDVVLHHLNIRGLTFSPIKGGDGNIEYLLYVSKTQNNIEVCIGNVVNDAFGRAEGN